MPTLHEAGMCRGVRWLFILVLLYFLFSGRPFISQAAEADIPREERSLGESKKNKVYERLKEKMDNGFEKGMAQIESAETIEITGNLPERVLRSVANVLFKNLRSIKAGSLIIGVFSFVTGAALALFVKKDKKIRKRAVGVGMIAVPMLLLIVVFGISGYVSVFK